MFTRKSRKNKGRGQTVVEFALVLPIILLVLLGLIEFGRAFFIFTVVSNAAREGVRYGMVHPRDPAGMESAAAQRLVMVPTDTVSINISYDDGANPVALEDIVEGESRVVIQVLHDFEMMTPLFRPLFPATQIEFVAARTIVAGSRVRKTPIPPTPVGCTSPLTGVTISGPTSGYTGGNLTFIASVQPGGATLPITYDWSEDGLISGEGTAQATYSWATAGNKQVEVQAVNCGGAASDDLVVIISEPPSCILLTDVTLSGPTSGEINQDLSYSVSPVPSNATAPIAYSWSTDGLVSGQGTSAAVYNWDTVGNKNVSVSGSNCSGSGSGYDDQTVVIGPAGCPSPLTGVTISGPTSGEAGEDLVFDALIQPAGATTPIDYTWSTDGLVSGQGTAQATYNWATVGTQTIDVTAENCGGTYSFSDDHQVDVTQPAGSTLLVSFIGGYPCRGEEFNNNKGNIRVIAYVTDEYGFPITDATVDVQIEDGESGTLIHNGGGFYGNGTICWTSTANNYTDRNVTVTATKVGYTSGDMTETTEDNVCDGGCP